MKKLIIIIALMFVVSTKAQDTFSLSVVQDVKLAFTDDNHGNTPYTMDLVIKLEKQWLQREVGYIIMYPQVEIANLYGGFYTRYAAGVGYTFNTILEKLDISPSYNYGMIVRFDSNYFGTELQVEITYEIFSKFRLVSLSSYTQRGDIGGWTPNIYFGGKYEF